MSFLDFSLVLDIVFFSFIVAVFCKYKKLEKQVFENEKNLALVIRNPQAAKRSLLKERK